jgi:hypothetical protein
LTLGCSESAILACLPRPGAFLLTDFDTLVSIFHFWRGFQRNIHTSSSTNSVVEFEILQLPRILVSNDTTASHYHFPGLTLKSRHVRPLTLLGGRSEATEHPYQMLSTSLPRLSPARKPRASIPAAFLGLGRPPAVLERKVLQSLRNLQNQEDPVFPQNIRFFICETLEDLLIENTFHILSDKVPTFQERINVEKDILTRIFNGKLWPHEKRQIIELVEELKLANSDPLEQLGRGSVETSSSE